MKLHRRDRAKLAWLLFVVALGCCVGGPVATLVFTRPLTAVALASSAGNVVAFPLGFAAIGLVLGLRRPANPIGWLYGAAGLVWSRNFPGRRGRNTCSASTADVRQREPAPAAQASPAHRQPLRAYGPKPPA